MTKKEKNMTEIKFAKIRPTAKIPTKRPEDVGYDIYADLNDVNYIVIEPHETELIPTGLASAFDADYGFILKERSSVGSKGIALRCGVIDSGYRGEWKVALTNTTNKPFIIKKDDYNGPLDPDAIIYSDKKAIVQAMLVKIPVSNVIELSYDQLQTIKSERGIDGFGSTNNIG